MKKFLFLIGFVSLLFASSNAVAQVSLSTAITNQPAASTLTGSELIPGVQSGGAVKMTAQSIQALSYVPTNKQFGAVGDGVTDDAAADNAFLAYVETHGGQGTWAPGTYLHKEQVTLTVSNPVNVDINGAGAVIETQGAISALKISGGQTPYHIRLVGLAVNDVNNTTATAGFELSGTTNFIGESDVVDVGNNSSTFKPFYIHNSNPADPNTGSFWTSLPHSYVRADASPYPSSCVYLEGDENATNLADFGGASGCVAAIVSTYPPGNPSTGESDGVVIGGWYEGVTDLVDYIGSSGGYGPYGLIIDYTRLESLTGYVLNLMGGATANSGQPPVIGSHNTYLQTVNALLNNPQSLNVSVEQSSNGLGIDAPSSKFNNDGYALNWANSASPGLTLNAPNSGIAYAVTDIPGFGAGTIGTIGIVSNAGSPVYDIAPGSNAGLPTMTIRGVGAEIGVLSYWKATYTGSCTTANPIGETIGSFTASGACSGTIIQTFRYTAPNGWSCNVHDLTTPADAMNETAYTPTSVTYTGTMAASDLATFDCRGF